jgi:hypothetical protein
VVLECACLSSFISVEFPLTTGLATRHTFFRISGHFHVFDEYILMGNPACFLLVEHVQYFPILYTTEPCVGYCSVWCLVRCLYGRGKAGTDFPRAGVPSIYDSQCANAGPTGICVSVLVEVDEWRVELTRVVLSVQRLRGRAGKSAIRRSLL